MLYLMLYFVAVAFHWVINNGFKGVKNEDGNLDGEQRCCFVFAIYVKYVHP